jgi:ArsR family transcriptional regulator
VPGSCTDVPCPEHRGEFVGDRFTVCSLAHRIDQHQYRRVSISLPLLVSSGRTRQPLSVEESAEYAAVFKALGDPVRLRLLSLIAAHEGGEACVCDLTGAFSLSQPTISHHLKVLRDSGLVTSERRGTWVHYRLRPEVLGSLADLLVPAGAPLPSSCSPDERDPRA